MATNLISWRLLSQSLYKTRYLYSIRPGKVYARGYGLFRVSGLCVTKNSLTNGLCESWGLLEFENTYRYLVYSVYHLPKMTPEGLDEVPIEARTAICSL
jgi:hypothetical protein